jgi:hypothetical protein
MSAAARFPTLLSAISNPRKYSSHLRGMLLEGSNNQVLATRGECNHPNAPVFGAFDPADEAFFNEALHRNTDRTRGQIDNWADRTHR